LKVTLADGPSSPPPLRPSPAARKPNKARLFGTLAFLVAAMVSWVSESVLQPFRIPTGAMQPTLMGKRTLSDGRELPGDRLFAEKISLRFRAPARGDIVVFKTDGITHLSVPPDQMYIKRVVGIPGDRLLFEPPGVRVNGQLLTEPAIFRKIAARTNGHSGYCAMGDFGTSREIALKANEYFVAGDNSTNSLDSRHFGPIRREQIIGRASFTYSPWERMGFLE
jgi:signal peptidase I